MRNRNGRQFLIPRSARDPIAYSPSLPMASTGQPSSASWHCCSSSASAGCLETKEYPSSSLRSKLLGADARQALRSEVVPVVPLAEDVCRQATLLDPERSITWGSLPDVAALADRDGLKQVILILIDNALKHTTGPITISGGTARDRVTLRVRDSGPGVGPEALPHIFERFYRGETSPAGADAGLGLGLPIAKALIEAQGGTIAVESDVARGSTFIVTLPRAPGEPAI